MKYKNKKPLVLLGLFAFCSCADIENSSKTAMFGANLQRTGVYDTTPPEQLDKVLWRFKAQGFISNSPVIYQGVVFFGSTDDDQVFYAVDAETGRQKWRNSLGSGKYIGRTLISSSAMIADSVVFFGSVDHRLYALDVADGQEKWRYESGGPIISSPAVTDGNVYFGSLDGHVYSLDAKSGQKNWTFTTEGEFLLSPAITDETVYIANTSFLYALDSKNGSEVWKFKADNHDWKNTPAIYDDVIYIYISSHGGTSLSAIACDTGLEIWRYDLGARVITPVAINVDHVYFGGGDGYLHAIDRRAGNETWRFNTGYPIRSSPSIAEQTIYIGSEDGFLYALDSQTGEGKSHLFVARNAPSTPAVFNGSVYITDSFNLCAVGMDSTITNTASSSPQTQQDSRKRQDSEPQSDFNTTASQDYRRHSSSNDIPPPPPPPPDDSDQAGFLTPMDVAPSPVGGIEAIQRALEYPSLEYKAGIEGRVIVHVHFSEHGEVIEAKIIKSIGNDRCDNAAIQAIKAVKWLPASYQGKPVKVWIAIPVFFKLK